MKAQDDDLLVYDEDDTTYSQLFASRDQGKIDDIINMCGRCV